jgi:DNA-directed RNA polymerase subunit M/transcription elongation factor TFIIS
MRLRTVRRGVIDMEQHEDVICPKCESEEWDYVEFERGMEDGDKPFFRCGHCLHEWREL